MEGLRSSHEERVWQQVSTSEALAHDILASFNSSSIGHTCGIDEATVSRLSRSNGSNELDLQARNDPL
jgi:hypothetical protein